MKVLLLVDVAKLGYLGDVVEAKAGYARNYLIPNGIAVVPTEANLRSIAKEKTHRAEQRISDRKRLEEACAKTEGAEAVLAAKANEQGVLFGSVTVGQIATNLREQGYDVADNIVHLAEHIKHLGAHSVSLKFAEDLETTVNVTVVREGGEQTETKTDKVEKAKKTEAKKVETVEQEKQMIADVEQAKQQPQEPSEPEEKKKRKWFGKNKE